MATDALLTQVEDMATARYWRAVNGTRADLERVRDNLASIRRLYSSELDPDLIAILKREQNRLTEIIQKIPTRCIL